MTGAQGLNTGTALEQPGGIDLVMLTRIAWARRYLVISISLAFGVAATVLALTATPVFTAETVVSIVQNPGVSGASSIASQLGGLAGLAGLNIGNNSVDEDAQAILESRHLIEEFVKRQDLVRQLKPVSGTPPTLWFTVKRMQDTVVSIREDKITNLTTVSVDWTDPTTAANWANGLVTLANDLMRTRAVEQSRRNIAFLNDQASRTSSVDVRQALFNMIVTETKNLMLASGRIDYAFRVVDPAVVPELRSRPRRGLMVLSGLVLGGFAGVIVAALLDLFARRRLKPDAAG